MINMEVKMNKIMSGLALLTVVAFAPSVMAGPREDKAVVVTVYKQVSREGVIYTYSVTNHSKYPILAVWIGSDNYNDTTDADLSGEPPTDIRGVDNWTGRVITVEDSDEFFLEWETNGKGRLLPGQTVTGFRVGMAQEDQRYMNLHWTATLLGTPIFYASSLVKVVEPPDK
jgi:hypothetical protein